MNALSEITSAVAAVVTVILAAIGLFYSHWQKRDAEFRKKEDDLRKSDVLSWSQDVIETLQTIVLITENPEFEKSQRNNIIDLAIKTSCLLERGRLFFKNTTDLYGEEKEEAFRGFRPEILDQLLIAHIAAKHWTSLSEENKNTMRQRVQACARRFVSLAQKEVGRDRTVSASSAEAGESISLIKLLR